MATTAFKVEGLRNLEDRLVELGNLLGKPSQPLALAGRRAWKPILALAQSLCPVSTWSPKGRTNLKHLRDAIMITVKKPTAGNVVLVCGLKIKKLPKGMSRDGADNPRRRWHLVEFGTKKMGARPYIRPAFDTANRQCVEIFRNELKVAVDRLIAKRGRAA